MTGAPTAEVYRIDWLPGTDVLHGICHCGAERTAEDPVELWGWMLAHPTGHDSTGHHPTSHHPTGHDSTSHDEKGRTP